MDGVLSLSTSRTNLAARVQHCAAHGSVSWPWLSLSMVFLVPRGHRLCGEWPLLSALGALLKIPFLPCRRDVFQDQDAVAGVVVQGQVKLVLPGLSSPGGFCPASLLSVTASHSPDVLPLCSSMVCGGRRELCHRVGIRGGGGSPSAVGRTNVIDLLWHLTKPQTLIPLKKLL